VELARNGNQIRRPLGAYLRDGVFELRVKLTTINYRILYGFDPNARNVVVLTHGFTKEKEVPKREIELAILCMKLVREDRNKYTADFEF